MTGRVRRTLGLKALPEDALITPRDGRTERRVAARSRRRYAALTAALIIAGAAAFPINRWLISRGKGHAVVHQQHAH